MRPLRHHTHEWFGHVYDNLLDAGGILAYHDVTNGDFPDLARFARQRAGGAPSARFV
jgi:hypothetical protein